MSNSDFHKLFNCEIINPDSAESFNILVNPLALKSNQDHIKQLKEKGLIEYNVSIHIV